MSKGIEFKSSTQILAMRAAGLIVARALSAVRRNICAGVTTLELDQIAESVIRDAGAIPSFKGYHGFPATLCVSINDEIVHGIPGKRQVQAGDLISIDCGAILNGWHGDSAFSMIVEGSDVESVDGSDVQRVEGLNVADQGQANSADQELLKVTESALWAGIAACANGSHVGDIGNAIDAHVAERFGIIEDYTGHGIGTQLHMKPDVLNYATRHRGPKLKPGLCIAIEPMLVAGSIASRELSDGWTVVTSDGKKAAHFEHTVAITEHGPWVLTEPDGGVAKLAELGVPVTPLQG